MYFKNVILARNRVTPWRWSKKIETCWSNFKCFNVKKFYVCALVGVLIRWLYKMHGATMKIVSSTVYRSNLWNAILLFLGGVTENTDAVYLINSGAPMAENGQTHRTSLSWYEMYSTQSNSLSMWQRSTFSMWVQLRFWNVQRNIKYICIPTSALNINNTL